MINNLNKYSEDDDDEDDDDLNDSTFKDYKLMVCMELGS